jgi:hypothetical protein
MWKLGLVLATATMVVLLAASANEAGAESKKADGKKKDPGGIAITCGGVVQRCPEGKKAYCNRWRPCKGKAAKVRRYCDAPICMTERLGGKS